MDISSECFYPDILFIPGFSFKSVPMKKINDVISHEYKLFLRQFFTVEIEILREPVNTL